MPVKLLLNEKFLWAAIALIKAEKKEVYVMAYLMNVRSKGKGGGELALFKELADAKKRGLDCRVILNYTQPENKTVKLNVEAGKWLIEKGIECRYVPRNRTVHAKMIIIGGVTLIIGSHNWSQRGMERNVEASVGVQEEGIVKEAREKFLEFWKDAVSMEVGK